MSYNAITALCVDQIGDNTEIMYFVANTEKEMEDWLQACRHGENIHTHSVC